MKTRVILFITAILFLAGCKFHKEVKDRIIPRPDDITQTELCQTLYANILGLFPRSNNNMKKHPALFDDTYTQRIVLTKDTEVFVTFIGEEASRSNTLGWYAYQENETPRANYDIKEQVIFPIVSHGVLEAGDTRKINLGKFKAGTVIGFYLIVSGWNAQSQTIDFKQNILYTDALLNKGGVKQHILFSEKQCNDLIVGFEDTNLNVSDHDFNDILFKVSDNDQQHPSTSFNLEHIPSL